MIDADISKFFDSIDHKELMSVFKRRVIDERLLRIIGKWLSTGAVEEDGRRVRGKQGTLQGSIISPMLANIFLHTVLDDFVHKWRKTKVAGEAYIVRYADDFVILARYQGKQLQEWVEWRLEDWLELVINRKMSRIVDLKKPEVSLDFLGFTFRFDRDKWGRGEHYA